MKKFLIIQTASIGDVILTTPLIEKLHHFFPDATIDFLTKKGNESLLLQHKYINQLIVWDKSKNKYTHLLSTLKHIRKQKYDHVINVQRFASTGIITAFSRAKNTIGFVKNPLSFLFTTKIKHQISSGIHEIDRNLSLIQHLTDGLRFFPKLYPTSYDEEIVKHFKNRPYVCIAPASLWFTKQFPTQKWIEFIKNIPDTFNVYLIGSHMDTQLCDQIVKLSISKKIVNLSGQLSLLQSASLMRDAVMNFMNDSAPMHLASAVNAPTTAIFCSTTPAFGFGPLSSNSCIIETTELLNCRPCGLHGKNDCPEKHFKCAQSIQINQLVDRIS